MPSRKRTQQQEPQLVDSSFPRKQLRDLLMRFLQLIFQRIRRLLLTDSSTPGSTSTHSMRVIFQLPRVQFSLETSPILLRSATVSNSKLRKRELSPTRTSTDHLMASLLHGPSSHPQLKETTLLELITQDLTTELTGLTREFSQNNSLENVMKTNAIRMIN